VAVSAATGVRRLRRRVSPGEAGRRAADLLQSWLREALERAVPMARVRALVSAGAVRVNGSVSKAAGRPLRAGQRVEALVRPDLLVSRAASLDRPFRLTPRAILHRDSVLLAVDKPPGLPTHPTADPLRPSLVGHVRSYLGERGGYLAVHQRLDRDTSGVVLFATDPRANPGLARAFAGRQVEKTYLALTARPDPLPPHRLRICAPLASSGKGGVVVGGREAKDTETEVTVREVLADALLVEARPLTGRKHQVRVHLAHAGMPILGDAAYGEEGARAPRTMLHAQRLVLPHPLTGELLVVRSPTPADFEAVLARLRSGRSDPSC
jgi:23S rRNA pseudouridine1911/1915/1917 synthase